MFNSKFQPKTYEHLSGNKIPYLPLVKNHNGPWGVRNYDALTMSKIVVNDPLQILVGDYAFSGNRQGVVKNVEIVENAAAVVTVAFKSNTQAALEEKVFVYNPENETIELDAILQDSSALDSSGVIFVRGPLSTESEEEGDGDGDGDGEGGEP